MTAFETDNSYLCVHGKSTGRGNLIYVIVANRAAFDLIDLPLRDNGPKENGGHVLSKASFTGSLDIIFQFWIAQPPHASSEFTGGLGA
jgi:hypothetical protein